MALTIASEMQTPRSSGLGPSLLPSRVTLLGRPGMGIPHEKVSAKLGGQARPRVKGLTLEGRIPSGWAGRWGGCRGWAGLQAPLPGLPPSQSLPERRLPRQGVRVCVSGQLGRPLTHPP